MLVVTPIVECACASKRAEPLRGFSGGNQPRRTDGEERGGWGSRSAPEEHEVLREALRRARRDPLEQPRRALLGHERGERRGERGGGGVPIRASAREVSPRDVQGVDAQRRDEPAQGPDERGGERRARLAHPRAAGETRAGA